MADAPAPPPAEPETPEQRAARFGYVILKDGQYVEKAYAQKPPSPPFQRRFAVGGYDPNDHDEQTRQAVLASVRTHCAEVFAKREVRQASTGS